MASWNWYLTDNKNNPLALLDKVTAKQIAYTRNSFAEATATMLHSDPAASAMLSYIGNSSIPRLQAWRTGRNGTAVCRFCGEWAPSSEVLNDAATISLTFRSPFYTLLGDGSSRGRFTVNTATPAAGALTLSRSASLNIADLLAAFADANNPNGYTLTLSSGGLGYAGLDIGLLDINGASSTQTPSYSFANVGTAIQSLTQVSGGVDFYERYSPDTTGGTGRMAYLDTYGGPGLGSDKSATVRVEYGPTTLNNVSEVTRGLDYPANLVWVLGANGLVGYAQSAVSRGAYGDRVLIVSASSVADQTTLSNMAQSYLRVKPIKTIGFTPALQLANCPQPFDDFDLGDTVLFQGNRDAFTESGTKVQINGFTLGIDDDTGLETMMLTDPLNPDGDESVPGQITGEVL